MIKLSIIIVNFNTGRYLQSCLHSVLESVKSITSYEIIVVDNGSDDNSLKYVKEIKNTKIKTILNGKNYGFSKANNIGIKAANGEYILLLNPDTVVRKNSLIVMLKMMEMDKKIGVATCRVILASGQLDDACHRGFPTPWNAFCHFSGLEKLFPNSQFFDGYHLGFADLDKIHEIDSCVGAFMLIRKTCGDSVNWLDEDYFWYGEDLDFCYRVKSSGWKIVYNPNTEITHYKGITSGIKSHSVSLSTAPATTRQLATNARFDVMKIFYEKHYRNKYPRFIYSLVLAAIEIKRKFAFLKLSI